jgi:hypothetical protein
MLGERKAWLQNCILQKGELAQKQQFFLPPCTKNLSYLTFLSTYFYESFPHLSFGD